MGELVALAKAQPGKLNFASTGPGSLPHLAGELFRLTAKVDIVHAPLSRRGARIALGAPQRAPSAPEIPTTAEVGIENWYGMIAPAGTSPAIVAALNRITTTALSDPSMKQKLAAQGMTAVGDTPEHFRTFIDGEIRKCAKVIKDAGVETAK
jgi:tripartite-type tricarboxylate transporter receptor subunit TctC